MKKRKLTTSIKKSLRRLKYLDKTQSSYFIVTSFLAAFLMFTGFTYSYFTLSNKIGNATISIAKLGYSLSSPLEGYTNDTITVPAGETIFLDLDLRSFNSQKTRYALNYKINSGEVAVYYSENLKKNTEGIIGPKGSIINLRIVLVNSGTIDASVSFEVNGGYLQNTVSSNIVNGYFEQDQTIRYVVYDEEFDNSIVQSTIPEKGTHSFYKAECSNGGTPVFDETNWTFSIGNEVQTSCDVYFKKANTGLEKYYRVTGTNGITLTSMNKPDTTGEYIYESSKCSNNAVYTFDETTFEFNVTSSTPNTLCVADFTTNRELEEAKKVIITFD